MLYQCDIYEMIYHYYYFHFPQKMFEIEHLFITVQLLNQVQFFATPWTAALQASLSFIISWRCSNSYPMSWWSHPTILSSVVPFSSCPQSFPASGSFPMIWPFASGGQSTGASASALVLPVNIQDWFPLELTGLISLQYKGLSRVFSNTIVQKHQFSGTQPSLWSDSHIHTWLLEKVMSLLFNMLSRFAIAFLPRRTQLLILWLQSLSSVILEPPKIKSLTVFIVSPSICHKVMDWMPWS